MSILLHVQFFPLTNENEQHIFNRINYKNIIFNFYGTGKYFFKKNNFFKIKVYEAKKLIIENFLSNAFNIELLEK